MTADQAIRLTALLLPIIETAGVNAIATIQGLKDKKTVEELIAEAEAKRNDLPELDFGR